MKVPGWQAALSALVCERLHKPFGWGVHDCCLWAADCVLLQTGDDPAADLRGSYRDELGAARLLADLGGLRGIAGQALGEPIPPLTAQIGDVVLVSTGADADARESLAVCTGLTALATGARGLEHVPQAHWLAAWRVGWGQ